ncbi:MAG: hypothetical protein JRN53_06700 [Nitrososphaerota archaeon]|nr:hypothetical protein [Nitrososphaerota archaeon]
MRQDCVNEDPQVIEEDGEHQVDGPDRVIRAGGLRLNVVLDSEAGFYAPAPAVLFRYLIEGGFRLFV